MKTELFYTSKVENVAGSHLGFDLRLFERRPTLWDRPTLILGWLGFKFPEQANAWQGFSFSLPPATRCPADIGRAAKLAERLAKAMGLLPGAEYQYIKLSPEDVLSALEKMGAVEVVLDPRLDAYVEVSQLVDRDVPAWTAINERGIWLINVVAKNEEQARCKARIQLAEEAAKDDYAAQQFADWVASGQRIKPAEVLAADDGWHLTARERMSLLPQPE